jgi:pimeloyl-ACP methyl ester carboxylesterase
VLVYHSFGTYITSSYVYLFPSNRVIGMMDVGGAPLRFSPEIQESVAAMDYFTF